MRNPNGVMLYQLPVLACAVSEEPGDSRKTVLKEERRTSVENVNHHPPEVFIYIRKPTRLSRFVPWWLRVFPLPCRGLRVWGSRLACKASVWPVRPGFEAVTSIEGWTNPNRLAWRFAPPGQTHLVTVHGGRAARRDERSWKTRRGFPETLPHLSGRRRRSGGPANPLSHTRLNTRTALWD